jgi:hypothetical protein
MSLQLYPGALVNFRPDSAPYRDCGLRFATVHGVAVVVLTVERAVAGGGQAESVKCCEHWLVVRTLPCCDCPDGEMLLVHPSAVESPSAPGWN